MYRKNKSNLLVKKRCQLAPMRWHDLSTYSTSIKELNWCVTVHTCKPWEAYTTSWVTRSMSCTILTRHKTNDFNCKFCIVISIIIIPQWIRNIHVCWHKFWYISYITTRQPFVSIVNISGKNNLPVEQNTHWFIIQNTSAIFVCCKFD